MPKMTIQHEGDTWQVLGVGVQKAGEIYVHLASTTRFRKHSTSITNSAVSLPKAPVTITEQLSA